MSVTAIFPKSGDPRCVATFSWRDGTVATTPSGGRPQRLPHDLDHYIVEAAFRPPYGFWNLVARQAPFSSLTLVRGRWPKGRAEWLDRVIRKHGAEMLKAEATGLRPLFEADSDEAAMRLIPQLRRELRRSYALTSVNAFADAPSACFATARELHNTLHGAWRQVPMGGALQVCYPPTRRPEVLTRFDA